MESSPNEVLRFWFEDCRPHQWFQRNSDFDALVFKRFGELTSSALNGDLNHWNKNPTSALALVLILDQFCRQLWRNQPTAFAGDRQALHLTHRALAEGWIACEPQRVRRQFWLMPMLHSEQLQVVTEAVSLLERWSDPATVAVAIRKKDLLLQFGRYPQRNAALGRLSTAREMTFLQNRQSPGKTNPSKQQFCERCLLSGPTFYRVKTAALPKWILVCPSCWSQLHKQDGYSYGGTRKANRRARQGR